MAVSKIEKRLLRALGKANRDFELIETNDHIMVAVSGGKDSWALLELLTAYRRQLPFDFDITAVTLDQGQPGFDPEALKAYSKARGHNHKIIFKDTFSVVVDKTPADKTFCSLCSRMRRGILYAEARALGAQKIALGHHRDDLIETLLLNQFFSGRIRGMAVHLKDPNSGIDIIRPLAYCAESDLAQYASECGVPIVPCNLCGSQSGMERQEIKTLISQLEKRNPRIRGNLLAALGNIEPTHCMDHRLQRTEDINPGVTNSLIQVTESQ